MKKMTAVVIGYGGRGATYAEYAVNFPEKLEIVAVADPQEIKRESAKKLHNLTDDQFYLDWRDLANQPKMADIAIIATQDNEHYEPSLAMIEKGYHLLLEKPMAFTPSECKGIAEAAERKGVQVIVCHVLRFTPFYKTLKDLVDDGAVGNIVSVSHYEDVGLPNYMHSFVRGKWRHTDFACPMIVAKTCHDFDILQWIIGKQCKKVQSFGTYNVFTPENKPEGAPERCIDGCPHGETCYYNTMKFYFDPNDPVNDMWRRAAANTIFPPTDEEVMQAMRDTEFGLCIYNCGQNIVDRQIVNMEYEDGITVTLTMVPFTPGDRYTRIYGTDGFIEASMHEATIKIYSFATKEWKTVQVELLDDSIAGGHGGGDYAIMDELFAACRGEEVTKSICDVRTSYLNHIHAYGAEYSRLNGGMMVDIDKWTKEL